MARIPPRFYRCRQGPVLEQTLERLLCADDRMCMMGLDPPTRDRRLQIALKYAEYVDRLHQLDVVLGDINFGNWLWNVSAQGAEIFAIDVDSYRLRGSASPVAALFAPSWDDPGHPSSTNFDSDNYKLGLAVLRIIAREPHLRPGLEAVATLRPGCGSDLMLLIEELGKAPPGDRPLPSRWMTELHKECAASAGAPLRGSRLPAPRVHPPASSPTALRPMIAVAGRAPQPLPKPGRVPVRPPEGTIVRPMIVLTQHDAGSPPRPTWSQRWRSRVHGRGWIWFAVAVAAVAAVVIAVMS